MFFNIRPLPDNPRGLDMDMMRDFIEDNVRTRLSTVPGVSDITVRGGAKLAKTLADHLDEAMLYRRLATLDLDAPTITEVDELRWTGPAPELAAFAATIDASDLVAKAERLAAGRS